VIPIDLSRPASNGSATTTTSISKSPAPGGKVGRGNGKEPSLSPAAAAAAAGGTGDEKKGNETLWPAWVYCTRYSDRPSSGKQRSFIVIVSVILYLQSA
jgi:hypothetical protein